LVIFPSSDISFNFSLQWFTLFIKKVFGFQSYFIFWRLLYMGLFPWFLSQSVPDTFPK
jgi:hypothetical protein